MNRVYKGICTNCKEKENERLNLIREANPEIENVEDQRRTTEYIGETCKSLHTRSNQHLDKYRLLDKDSFILKHHITHHPELRLGEVKMRFETHKSAAQALEDKLVKQ